MAKNMAQPQARHYIMVRILLKDGMEPITSLNL